MVLGILALSLVAGLLVVTRTGEYGIGLSPDSVQYVSMARELATGHDTLAGEHLRPTWPPLFTLLISAPGVAGVDPIAVATVLNPAILVCICLVAGLWLYRRTNSGFIGIVVTAALAFSTEGIFSLAENAERVVVFLGVWALPWGRPDYDLSVFVSGLPLIAVMGFALAWGWSSYRSRGVAETFSCLKLSDPFVRVLGAFAVVYIAFVLVVSTAVRIDRIHVRLLVPAFVPLALLAGFVVERLIAMSRSDRGRRFGGAFAAAVVLFAASHVAVYIPELRYAAQEGHGYASSSWEMSATIAWARAADDKRLLTNRGDALYLLVPGVAVEWLPRGEAQLPSAVASIGNRRVVWLQGTRYPYDLRDLAPGLGLR
ncbi:MAG: hypothetical protein F4Z28_11535, partial [Gammaproteobacteria bacterium]|nr:hypothetical protein [Gammaproteobacteria bacterium]